MPVSSYPCFVQYRDQLGHWYWIYYDPNEEAVARSIETYLTKEACTIAVNQMKASQSHPVFAAS